MLVHKGTMGVLDTCWTGRYRAGPGGVREPEMKEYTLGDVSDSGEWWSVPRGSALGRKLRRLYPFCVPVTDGGELLDVCAIEAPRAKAEEPGQKTRQRRRRAGLLENMIKERGSMSEQEKYFTMVDLREADNGGHANNSPYGTPYEGCLPDGWAIFPDGHGVENFPFFHVDAVDVVDRLLTVTAWHPLPVPPPEPPSVEEQISALKSALSATDYKIIKCTEYSLAGLEAPYDLAELHAQRQALRDRINELEGMRDE